MRKRFVSVTVAVAVLAGVAAAAMAQGPGGWGPGMMGPGMMGGWPGQYGWPGMGPGMMGPGMGWGQMGPGMMGPGMMGGPGWTPPQTQLTEENAKGLAQQYADKYLKGFTVERVLPFAGMGGMTMYQAELKGSDGETRVLHVNPWGNVMPFGGPQTRVR